ncbi:glycosyltransferase family 2 protein [Methylobacterium nonmethylotrophicum]|uniref:Glycosyltransferase family 2 protein n=1 Tax=Methylobacterium nonmethylotrophicum TaxID=1141884 RepID=A0A4Z0NHM2_9HYPH|nr:glycosyltransferase family 2 protein [Methylobacterium nonmethylotrophicum]TGD95495.1 glycosyltransferase family 2 protein [Methylobacterium nonmethylotrophicum]
MQIHLYCMCLNEEKIIPYFLAHYRDLITKFYVFDNGSTDRSLDLLAGDERISVAQVATQADSFADTYTSLMNNAWKGSRESADWIVTAEMDEHLHHPDLPAYLGHCRREGVTVLTTVGYNMIAERFPTDPRPLWQQIVRGARATAYDKPAIFDPQAIDEINYGHGRHGASPSGRVAYEARRQVKLLHYKSLGLDHVCERNDILAQGLRKVDLAERHGEHYLRNRAETRADFETIRAHARRVPGLRLDGAPPEPILEDELDLLSRSGLFDAADYLARNPDVAAAGIAPLMHFCTFGWREDRSPNRHFSPSWYRRTYRDSVAEDMNPLLDYVLTGERLGRFPAPHFDPELYRAAEGLPVGVSPLGHLLATERAARSGGEPSA